jgi:HEAT repeat protein
MIRFACPTCKSILPSPAPAAGNTIACPQCGQRLSNPNPARMGWEMAAGLFSLMLALAVIALFGWLIWILPPPRSQPSVQHSEGQEQPANLDQITALPLVSEVESSPKEEKPPPPSRMPPPPLALAAAKKHPSDPPPTVESRPPQLPSPPRTATATRPDKPSSGGANRGKADSLVEELVKAATEQQEILLEKMRQGKGPEYTQALASAIGQLSGEAKEKARQTLAERLTRFTANTLLAYLGSEDAELRRAAALALGMKDDKDHISELTDLLGDSEPSVVEAAHAALQKLTSRKDETEKRADSRPAQTQESQNPTSPSRLPRHIAKAPPPPKNPPAPKEEQKKEETGALTKGSQGMKTDRQKQDGGVPDVSFGGVPAETSGAVKATIRANTLALFSKRASERMEAAKVLGGLGEEGKPARRSLCAAMLDPVIAVRVAAADALKNIDPKMHYLAVVLATEKVANKSDADRVAKLLEKKQKIEEDGEPLTPLVIFVVKYAAASYELKPLLITSLGTLSRIGRKDLSSYRVMATALTNRDEQVRAVALRGLARMKHGKLAVSRILALMRIDVPDNRIAAIEALTALADESTEEILADAIAAQRYHDDEKVRRAVESALNKLENKQAP